MAINYSEKRPLVSVPQFVKNPNASSRIKIMFITENYPKNMNHVTGNTCVYRLFRHPKKFNTSNENQMLNNLSCAMGIKNPMNELKLLDQFLNKSNYFIIDTYQHGQIWKKNTPLCGTINEIAEDINFLNPEQIIFCYERSNTIVFNQLIKKINPGIKIVRPVDKTGKVTGKVFKSPTGQWFHTHHYKNGNEILGFYDQIQLAIKYKKLTV